MIEKFIHNLHTQNEWGYSLDVIDVFRGLRMFVEFQAIDDHHILAAPPASAAVTVM